MKLTNEKRDHFIEDVMRDVPNKASEIKVEVLAQVEEWYKTILPKEIKKLAYTNATSFYIRREAFVKLPRDLGGYVHLPGKGEISLPSDISEKCEAAAKVILEETNKLSELKSKLRTIAYGCTTLKQLKEALPEFEKYMPEEQVFTKNLPAVANVVSEFVKAGWPKETNKNG